MRNDSKIVQELLSYKEVGILLGVTSTTLHRMRNDGRITPIRFSSRLVRFDKAEILALIEQAKSS